MKGWTTLDVTEPKDGRVVRMNAWWACVDGDEKQALFMGKSPQCNGNKAIIEWAMKKDGFYPNNIQPVLIPVAFIPNRDYP